MNRGDVVLAQISFTEKEGAKRRPVVIIQADRFNQVGLDTISTNLDRVHQANQLRIDPAAEPGSGLRQPSAVRCDRLFTIAQSTIDRTIGCLSAPTMARINDCLKAALDLP